MQEIELEEPVSGFSVNDLLFTLFRHKWKILLATITGLLAAAGAYYFQSPIYQSDAKLLVRYVLDRSTVDPLESAANGSRATESVIGSELEILTSWDLALQVVKRIGVQKLLPASKGGATQKLPPVSKSGASEELPSASKAGAGEESSPGSNGGATEADAAAGIIAGLSATCIKGSNVIMVSYKNGDPALATLVLKNIVALYFAKHLEVHRSKGGKEIVGMQADLVRGRLNSTEDNLKKKKEEANIISIAQTTESLGAAMGKIQDELYGAEAERAEQRARVAELEKSLASGLAAHHADPPVKSMETAHQASNGEVQQYEALVRRLAQLRQTGLDLLARYTTENSVVKLNQGQIAELESQRNKLEEKYPSLVVKAAESSSNQSHQPDLATEKTRLAGIEARIEALNSRKDALQKESKKFSEDAASIAQLERDKELDEANYKYFKTALEKAQINDDLALDSNKIPNISEVQTPSPAFKVTGGRNKLLLALAGGGAALGMVLAFLIDIVIDTSIKLPVEFETRLRIPLLLSIPSAFRNGQLCPPVAKKRKILGPGEVTTASHGIAPWDPGHFIRPFAEAIRDRLVLYFEQKKMVYKPKLVAVTSCSGGEGVSTVAAGLAAALSETGDGKVLLVDMNVGGGEVHRFFEGRQTSSLIDAIEGGSSIPSAADNLYLAKASPAAGTTQIIPKRFYDLVPHFKATDFDYIIFDMPPLAQGSIALAMSGFMDKVLLVIEAEKSPRDAVKRTFGELVAANADVSVVFNKMRSYAPKWVEGVH